MMSLLDHPDTGNMTGSGPELLPGDILPVAKEIPEVSRLPMKG